MAKLFSNLQNETQVIRNPEDFELELFEDILTGDILDYVVYLSDGAHRVSEEVYNALESYKYSERINDF